MAKAKKTVKKVKSAVKRGVKKVKKAVKGKVKTMEWKKPEKEVKAEKPDVERLGELRTKRALTKEEMDELETKAGKPDPKIRLLELEGKATWTTTEQKELAQLRGVSVEAIEFEAVVRDLRNKIVELQLSPSDRVKFDEVCDRLLALSGYKKKDR